jgi:hypothetical protein
MNSIELNNNSRGVQRWIFPILLLGLALRLVGLQWGQGYYYFGQGDGMEAYSVAVDYGQGEPRAMYLAQPNFNERSKLPGPLWTMFCFAGLRFAGSIEGVVLASILLNTAAIYLTFLLAQRTIGPAAGLWAGLLAATVPSAVFYSLGVYNPQVMPFLGACLALALWEVVRGDRSPHIFWVVLLLMIMPQFHMAGIAMWSAVAVMLVVAGRRLSLGWLIAGAAVGALCYVPYLRGEAAHGWQNTIGMLSGRSTRSWDSLKTVSTPVNLLINWVPQWTHDFGEYRELGRACFGWFGILLAVNAISVVTALLIFAGIGRQLQDTMKGRWRTPRVAFSRAPGPLFLAILLVAPLAFALVSGHSFHARYALMLMPALLALAGGAVTTLLGWQRIGKFFTFALAVTVCANVWLMAAFYYHQGKRIEQGDLFIPSFRKMETVYQALKAHAGAGHAVQVEDKAYLHALSPREKARKEVEALRRYVVVREREALLTGSAPALRVQYRLCQAADVGADDSCVAFRGNGIALVAETNALSAETGAAVPK